jgi:hypothetical protein
MLNYTHWSLCLYVQVSIGAGVPVEQVSVGGDRTYLENVLSWLVINSMRVDSVQYNLLCEQSVSNVWRKRAFSTLKNNFRLIDSTGDNVVPVEKSLRIFRERLVHEVENSVPHSERYSQKIVRAISENG